MNWRYIAIEGVFIALIALAAARIDTLLAMPAWQIAALVIVGGLATFRAARTISYNAVMAWLRAPFCKVVKDSSGAGDSVEPKDGSVVGELLACPICSGTWAALALVVTVLYLPAMGWALITVLGMAGISEAVHWRCEREEWQGRAAMEQAGSAWIEKNQPPLVFSLPETYSILTEKESLK